MQKQGRVGDQAFCPADAHGCPGCPHPVIGPATSGSPDVLVNSLAALRDTDPGIHAPCCGPNTWNADGGAPHVLINNLAAFRCQDPTAHCGGNGQLVQGSGNVFVGNKGGGDTSFVPKGSSWIEIELVDDAGEPVPYEEYVLTLPDGSKLRGYLNKHGLSRVNGLEPGSCEVTFPKLDGSAWEPA